MRELAANAEGATAGYTGRRLGVVALKNLVYEELRRDSGRTSHSERWAVEWKLEHVGVWLSEGWGWHWIGKCNVGLLQLMKRWNQIGKIIDWHSAFGKWRSYSKVQDILWNRNWISRKRQSFGFSPRGSPPEHCSVGGNWEPRLRPSSLEDMPSFSSWVGMRRRCFWWCTLLGHNTGQQSTRLRQLTKTGRSHPTGTGRRKPVKATYGEEGT